MCRSSQVKGTSVEHFFLLNMFEKWFLALLGLTQVKCTTVRKLVTIRVSTPPGLEAFFDQHL